MADLAALLRQAQELQNKLKKLQEDAADKTVTAQAGGGMVRVEVDGGMQVRRVILDDALLAAKDKAMLEDLIVVAINDGLRQAQSLVAQEMGKLAGPLGGFKLPGLGGED